MTTHHKATSTATPTPEPREHLLQLTRGYRVTQVLYAAASLRIAEALRSGPCGARDLAAAVGAHEPSLVRLLSTLISLGLLETGSDGRYDLTDTGRLLDGQHPGSVRAGILYEGSQSYEHWREFVDSVRTGQNVYQRRYGVDAWTYRRTTDRQAEKVFDDAMQEHSASRVAAVMEAYDFSRLGTIIDVGGGRGSLLAGILKTHPTARGVLFDQPSVVAGAPAVLAASGVADRCRVVGGSFFESVPPDGDAYILSVIIHDWDDEPASIILGNCRRAMPTSSRLLLIERMLGDVSSHLNDLNMLHSLSGRERSEAEYRTLLARSGLRLARVVATRSPFGVVEAWPLA
jgi:hypothetical protein